MSQPDRTIVVSGLGRCGSSLVMQMLAAGGLEVLGTSFVEEWFGPVSGRKGAKILAPGFARGWPKDLDADVIWIQRDLTEQTKSYMKLWRELGIPIDSSLDQIAGKMAKAVSACFACFKALRLRVLKLSFEGLLENPRSNSVAIAGFSPYLDVDSMPAIVRKRSPECAEGLEIGPEILRCMRQQRLKAATA